MTGTIIRRKLALPPVWPGAIRRRRLLGVLDEAAAGGLHVALVAGPGYGKTALLADWCRDRNAAWLGLESEDADLDVFLLQLVAALETVVPDLSTSATTIGGQTRSREGALAAVSVLLADLDQQAERPAALILDDYHLAASSSLDLLVARLIKYLPGAVQLVLASRRMPDVQLAAWQARRRVRVIEEEELAFDADEISELRERHPGPAETPTAERVWPVSLGLPPERLDAYVEEEMLRGLPQEIQDFLQRAALLGTLDPDGCEAVLGEALAPERREFLLRHRLALISECGSLEMVRPLRDMLRRRFTSALPRPDRERILGAMGEYFWNRGQGLSAIRAWIEAGQARHAAQLLAQAADRWLAENRLEALANALNALEAERDRPDLLLVEGELHRRLGDPERAAERFDRAQAGFLASGDAPRLAQALLRKAQALAGRGDVTGAAELLASARSGIPPDDPLEADVANLEGALDLLRDKAESAAGHFDSSLRLALRFAEPYAAARAAHNLGVCHTKLGDYQRALMSYEAAMKPLEGQDSPPFWMSPINRALVLVYLDRAREAKAAAEDVLARVRRFNLTREEGFALRTLGIAHTALGERGEALACYESAEHVARRSNDTLGLAYSLNFQADFLAGTGETDAALRLSDEVLVLIGGQEALPGALEFAQARARVLAMAGRTGEAAPLVAMLIDQARSKGFRPLEREARELEAEIRNAGRDAQVAAETTGRDAAGEAGETSERPGLPEVGQRPGAHGGRETGGHVSEGDFELAVRCFGGMKVRASRGPVGERDWQSGRAKQLLAYLLHHPEGATKSRLLEMLYPSEVTTDGSLHMNLRRLRKALEPQLERGQPSRFILWSDGFYVFNRQARVEVDTWSFEATLRSGFQDRLDPVSEIARLKHALDLYGGEFLPEFDLDWVAVLRQRFRDKVLAACSRLCALLDGAAAVEVAHRALDIDPLASEFHRELILRFLEAGEPHRALEHYRLCERRYQELLGMAPPEDIGALVHDLGA